MNGYLQCINCFYVWMSFIEWWATTIDPVRLLFPEMWYIDRWYHVRRCIIEKKNFFWYLKLYFCFLGIDPEENDSAKKLGLALPWWAWRIRRSKNQVSNFLLFFRFQGKSTPEIFNFFHGQKSKLARLNIKLHGQISCPCPWLPVESMSA